MKFILWYASLAVFALVNCSKGTELDEVIINDVQLANKWLAASYDFDRLIYPQKDVVIRVLNDLISNATLNLTGQCSTSLSSLREGLKQRKFWAYKFIDSSGKGRSGLANGYTSDLGDHAGCLSIKVNGQEPFKGKYCLVNLKFPVTKKPSPNWLRPHKLNLTDVGLDGTIYEHFGNHSELFHHEHHTFALCVPSACSQSDVAAILLKTMGGKALEAQLKPNCEVEEEMISFIKRQPIESKICLGIVIFAVLFVALSTAVTLFLGESTPLKHFSAIRNSIKLNTEYRDLYMQRMRFMDVFKTWYHLCAMFAHMVVFLPFVPLVFGTMQDLSSDMETHWMESEYAKKAIYTTQVIFLMSGLLSSYIMLPIIARSEGKISFLSYAFKRWLRTAPTTIAMIICMFAASCFMRGPLATELTGRHLTTCRSSWWKTMLNMNNYDAMADICIPYSWSQSTDFQLWLIAYFPLMWLHKKPKLGIFACFALIAAGVAIPASVMWIYELPSTTSGRPIDMLYFVVHGNYFPIVHLGTHNNMASYFVGILMGYCFSKDIKPRRIEAIFAIFFACSTLAIGSIFAPYILTHFLGFTITKFWDAIYGGFFRLTYVSYFASFFYVAFFCQDFLKKHVYGYSFCYDHPIFVPLGRLSYSVYMAQLLPMAYYLTVSYEYIPIDRYYMGFRFIPVVITCWILGYITFLLFEAPAISLAKAHIMPQLAAGSIKTTKLTEEDYDINPNKKLE